MFSMNDTRFVVAVNNVEEMYDQLAQLQNAGFTEGDIQVVSKDRDDLSVISRHSEVETHKAGNVADKLKTLFTGEDEILEGLRKTPLTEDEARAHVSDIYNGKILIIAERNIDEYVSSVNPHVDEMNRGETFQRDPFMDRMKG